MENVITCNDDNSEDGHREHKDDSTSHWNPKLASSHWQENHSNSTGRDWHTTFLKQLGMKTDCDPSTKLILLVSYYIIFYLFFN